MTPLKIHNGGKLCVHGIFDLLEMCDFSRCYGFLVDFRPKGAKSFTNAPIVS